MKKEVYFYIAILLKLRGEKVSDIRFYPSHCRKIKTALTKSFLFPFTGFQIETFL